MLISAPGIHSGIRPAEVGLITGNGANLFISTAQSKFGNSSLQGIPTSSAQCQITPTTNFAFTGDFTIEFWWYPAGVTGSTLLGFRPVGQASAANTIAFFAQSGTMGVYVANASKLSFSYSANSWVSVALVRSGSAWTLYKNGTSTGQSYSNSNTLGATRCIIAQDDVGSGNYLLQGYMDEIRFSNIARYTANYTPATQPFIDDGNTVLLLHFDQPNGGLNVVDDNS